MISMSVSISRAAPFLGLVVHSAQGPRGVAPRTGMLGILVRRCERRREVVVGVTRR